MERVHARFEPRATASHTPIVRGEPAIAWHQHHGQVTAAAASVMSIVGHGIALAGPTTATTRHLIATTGQVTRIAADTTEAVAESTPSDRRRTQISDELTGSSDWLNAIVEYAGRTIADATETGCEQSPTGRRITGLLGRVISTVARLGVTVAEPTSTTPSGDLPVDAPISPLERARRLVDQIAAWAV